MARVAIRRQNDTCDLAVHYGALRYTTGLLAFHRRALALFSEESLVNLAASFELLDRCFL